MLLAAAAVLCGCAGAPQQEAAEQQAAVAPQAVPEVAVEQPQEKQDALRKRISLIAIDPGHQSWAIDMSATEPNAPGSSVMKAKATQGPREPFPGTYEYELNLDVSLRLRDLLEQKGFDTLMTRRTTKRRSATWSGR